MPTTVRMGATVEFEAVVVNNSQTGYASVAPVFQIVGGPANHVDGVLQRYDPASGTWQNAVMPEGDGGSPLAAAADGAPLPPGHQLVVRYRLTVTTRNPAEPTASILYAVALPGDRQLAITTVRSRITAG